MYKAEECVTQFHRVSSATPDNLRLTLSTLYATQIQSKLSTVCTPSAPPMVSSGTCA